MVKPTFAAGLLVLWLIPGIGLIQQTVARQVDWKEMHNFYPPDDEMTWVLTLGASYDGAVYAGLMRSPNSLFRTDNQGETWEPANLNAPHIEAILAHPEGSLFIAAYGRGVLHTDDGGSTWSENTLPSTLVWDLSIRGEEMLAATANGLFHSEDLGESWQLLSPKDSHRTLLASNGHFYLKSSDGSFISVDGGATWRDLQLSEQVTRFFEAPDGIILAATANGIARSADNGDTWDWVSTGHQATRFAMNRQGILFANANRMMRSDDGGLTWTDFADGLTENVISMTVDADGYLYAGARSGRVFRTLVSTHTGRDPDTELPEAVDLVSSHPNPFRHATVITFSLTGAERIVLELYDVQGRKLETLVSAVLAPGVHRVNWEPRALPAGVYVGRLQSESVSSTIKLVRH